jgi:hypothetical protein
LRVTYLEELGKLIQPIWSNKNAGKPSRLIAIKFASEAWGFRIAILLSGLVIGGQLIKKSP